MMKSMRATNFMSLPEKEHAARVIDAEIATATAFDPHHLMLGAQRFDMCHLAAHIVAHYGEHARAEHHGAGENNPPHLSPS